MSLSGGLLSRGVTRRFSGRVGGLLVGVLRGLQLPDRVLQGGNLLLLPGDELEQCEDFVGTHQVVPFVTRPVVDRAAMMDVRTAFAAASVTVESAPVTLCCATGVVVP